MTSSAAVMGRLGLPPHPALLELLYEPQLAADRQSVLPHLLRIDAAHLVMLARCGLLDRQVAASLLEVNRELAQRLSRGEDVLDAPPVHRGLYFLYERIYVERLGEQIGGSAHLARSRNDINATVTRMRLRDALLAELGDVDALLEATRQAALGHVDTVMCGFTHLQPAQPTSLGHYLCGVLSELVRCAESLQEALAALDLSPMGAAAGYGTTLPIDSAQVARLLGFSGPVANSADAVASRDYLIRALSGLAALGTCLTRLATDLQAWSSAAYGFLSWPDDLVSTSSIMPQKRNAFVLESIRGQATQAVGALVEVLVGLKSVPFANSIDLAEAAACCWPALHGSRTAVRLTTLLLRRMEVCPQRMRAFLDASQATMSQVADLLAVRHALPFRTAHDAVGRLAREAALPLTAADVRARLERILAGSLGVSVVLSEAELARCLDAEACCRAAAFGGGPAPAAVREQLEQLGQVRSRLAQALEAWRLRLSEADAGLSAAVVEVVGVTSEKGP